MWIKLWSMKFIFPKILSVFTCNKLHHAVCETLESNFGYCYSYFQKLYLYKLVTCFNMRYVEYSNWAVVIKIHFSINLTNANFWRATLESHWNIWIEVCLFQFTFPGTLLKYTCYAFYYIVSETLEPHLGISDSFS